MCDQANKVRYCDWKSGCGRSNIKSSDLNPEKFSLRLWYLAWDLDGKDTAKWKIQEIHIRGPETGKSLDCIKKRKGDLVCAWSLEGSR